MDKFGYISLSLLMLPIWIYIYTKAKWLRLRMRNIGIYAGIITVIAEPIFIADYWTPPPLFDIKGFYAIEDFAFSFLSAGIAIAIYNYLFKIKYKVVYPRRKKFSLILSIATLASFVLFNMLFDYNSIFTFCYSLIVGTLIMIIFRRDLFIPALVSGIIMTIILATIYMIVFNLFLTSYWYTHWKLIGTSYDYYIFNIPWTEYLYYFSIGFFISILYDFASGTAKTKT